MLAVREPAVQVQLLVWIFVMRVLMIVASGASYLINEAVARGRYAGATRMNFEAPLTSLVWLTSIVSVVTTYVASYVLIPDLGYSPPSSPAGRWPGPSSPSWSRSSPRPSRATSARW